MQHGPDIIERFRDAWREELGEELTREEATAALRALSSLATLLQRHRRAPLDPPST